jgi:hypothetical protein
MIGSTVTLAGMPRRNTSPFDTKTRFAVAVVAQDAALDCQVAAPQHFDAATEQRTNLRAEHGVERLGCREPPNAGVAEGAHAQALIGRGRRGPASGRPRGRRLRRCGDHHDASRMHRAVPA